MTKKIGILLTNTGTPDAPNTAAVRRYLREFLSDPRIVQLPKMIWLPILYALILPFRAKRSTELYQKIWTKEGSPMRIIMQQLAEKLAAEIKLPVAVGMNYGTPSIQTGLENLRQQQVEKIIVLPLFPQYSHTSTASSFDRVTLASKKLRLEKIIMERITSYANQPSYIDALAQSVKNQWEKYGKNEHLLISFHGIPERFVKAGDPYQKECEQTANLLAEKLNLSPSQWTLCYQSQFGYDAWLKPSTQQLFIDLPRAGVKTIDVICPGFAVDCLETLEEIMIRGKESFMKAGGQSLHYIPALNDSDAQINLLKQLILL